MAKYLLIAAIVISLATAGIGYVNHGKLADTAADLAQTKTSLTTSQNGLKTAQAAQKKAEETLKLTEAEKVKLAEDLLTAQGEAKTAADGLAAATKTGAEKDAKITDLEKQLADKGVTQPGSSNVPDPQIATLTQRVQELEASLTSANDQNKTLTTQLTDLKTQNENRVKGLAKKGLEGRILAVNPAWNFVVLSVGDKQGVSNNAEMLIKRSGQYLGKVRITSVEPSTSIADIVANTLPEGVAVQPGDSVIFQGSEGQE